VPHLKIHSKCERKNGGSLCLVCGSVVRVTDAGAEDRATQESDPSAVAGEYTIDGMTLGRRAPICNGAQPETSQCVCPTCEQRKAAAECDLNQFLAATGSNYLPQVQSKPRDFTSPPCLRFVFWNH
jgi:hypothetical protein